MINLEELFNKYLPILIHLFELMGILILTVGVFTAFYHYIQKRFFKRNVNIKYEFADVMTTTLDFKLAAEILKTVIIKFSKSQGNHLHLFVHVGHLMSSTQDLSNNEQILLRINVQV